MGLGCSAYAAALGEAAGALKRCRGVAMQCLFTECDCAAICSLGLQQQAALQQEFAAGTQGNAGIRPAAPGAPLDPGVTRPDSNTRALNSGQTAGQIAAANPQANVFRQNARTAATNPGESKLPALCFPFAVTEALRSCFEPLSTLPLKRHMRKPCACFSNSLVLLKSNRTVILSPAEQLMQNTSCQESFSLLHMLVHA